MISIIIPTKNAERTIKEVLDGINRQKTNYDIEIIIIDSGSQDKTINIISKFDVRLLEIKPEEFHHAKTRNMGASLATGDILVFLNGDAYPADRYWLPALVSRFDDMAVAAVYSRQIPPSGTNPINKFRVTWNYKKTEAIKSIETMPIYGTKYTFFFSTVSCAIRKSIWKNFKFPEDIPVYEDTALIRKIIGSGYKVIYEPKSVVYHAHNYSILGIFQRYFDTGLIWNKLNYSKNSSNKFQSEGISYLIEGIKFFIRKKLIIWIPGFIMHTAAGFIGLTLGKHGNKINPKLRNLFGKYTK